MTDPAPLRAVPEQTDDDARHLLTVTIPGLPPGAYQVRLAGVEPATYTDDATGEIAPRYRWTWTAEVDGRPAEMVQTTGRRATRNSRLLEVLVALAGPAAIVPAATIDLRELVGREAILSVEIGEGGQARVATVAGVPKGRAG